MRPHRLRVTAFGAFAGTEEVRFDELDGLFLLHGETGAGKTTLLDAIAYALYGEVPGDRGKARRLRSDHAAAGVATVVELEATIGGRRLRITRSPEWERPKRSGTGTTRVPASVRLEELAGPGPWRLVSARIEEAGLEIAGLMGMTPKQFFQVVLLPQGQFAQFLQADATKRAELLQRLFGTDRFRAVEDWLKARRNATREAVREAETQADQLTARVSQVAELPVPGDLPDPVAWARELTASAEAAQEEAARAVDALGDQRDAALVAERAAQELAARQQRRRDALTRQSALLEQVAPVESVRRELAAARRAAAVGPVLDEARRDEDTAARARAAAREARSALPAAYAQAEVPGAELPGAAELRAAALEQRVKVGRLEALRAVEQQAAAEEAMATAARQRAAGHEADIAAITAGSERDREARPDAARARDDARQAAEALPAAQATAATRHQVATDCASLVREHGGRQQLVAGHLAAREQAVALREEAQRLREARIDGMRAELAAALVDGAPCPVCGSLDHPELCELTGEPVSREQEQAAYAEADSAAAAADAAGRRAAAAEGACRELATRLAAAGLAVPEDLIGLAAATGQAAADAEDVATRLRAAASGLKGAQEALEELDAGLAEAARRLADLSQRQAAALAEAASADQRAAGHRRELAAELGPAADLEGALAATGRLADLLADAADATDEVARTGEAARQSGERAVAAATAAGFAGPGPGDGVAAARAALRDAAWRDAADQQVSQHEAETAAVAGVLAEPELDVPLDPPAPVAERARAASEAQQEHTSAVDAHSRLRSRAGQLRLLLPQLSAALAGLRPLRVRAEEESRLADLASGLGANQHKMALSAFVLAARLEEVAAAASQRLRVMSSGRYSLVHTDARRGGGKAGLGLLACDSWTGQDRDTATLSGGETFLASLALALGLADVVTAEAAGTPMEALFVDEGFGTLDEDTLEEVMTVLDGLREGGRMVGIVSHVSELRQRVPARIHVRKGHHGSHVSVVGG
jgi:exonuclease SbcC